MKKLILGAAMALFAFTTVLADGKVPAKKAVKKATCTACSKAKCSSKATCSNATSACVCK
ncbi:hypothetical protein [Mucilaginibacter auburnensis]|uniref:Uncharacterized protein n=1 Tax=Mucilaginibacter auburnensis TaxID=1457233 RepID=A0A2H9VPU4_9SPHI|nr:hypothetical protein [Mucilaginibacter auburnensis]PJJ80357.1 hypothetical protein CLV57_3507 [Mucilaginibacter auburnensis]